MLRDLITVCQLESVILTPAVGKNAALRIGVRKQHILKHWFISISTFKTTFCSTWKKLYQTRLDQLKTDKLHKIRKQYLPYVE
jgi:hypothetical protein